jgi:hypothetical protein
MKWLLIFLFPLIAAAEEVTPIKTTCTASPSSVVEGASVTLTETIASPVPAGKPHFEWHGRGLAFHTHYVNEADAKKSVVIVKTAGFAPGIYYALGRLDVISNSEPVGLGVCKTSFAVTK